MAKDEKKPRIYKAPIILDNEVEVAYNTLQHQAFADYQKRLESFKLRVENARVRFLDPVEAEAEVQRIIADDTAATKEWERRLGEAKKALDAVTKNYLFRSIGRKKFAELIDANPPTEADREEWDNSSDRSLPAAVNELGFAKALITASCISHSLTRTDVEEMFDDPAWNQQELTLLYVMARSAQLSV